jgi:hypothetical protein
MIDDMPDVGMRLGAFFLVPQGLAKVWLGLRFYRDNPAVVMMDVEYQGVVHASWMLSRDVLWNAAFNRIKSGDGDFIVEPIEQAGWLRTPPVLRHTLLCHLSSWDSDSGETHEHLIMSIRGVAEFLNETGHVVPPESEDYTPHIDRLLANIFK